MALGTYKDVYRLDSLIPRVNNIESALSLQNEEKYITQYKNELQDLINKFKDYEKSLYKALHLPESEQNIEGLRKTLLRYSNAVLNLSGPRLRDKIIGILEAENTRQYILFQEYTNRIVQEEIVPLIGTKIANSDEMLNTLEEAYLYYLREGHEANKELHIQSVKRARNPYTAVKDIFDNGRLMTEAITPNQKARWEEILFTKSGAVKRHNGLPMIKYTNNSISFNWFDVTGKEKAADIKKRVKAGDRQAINLVNKANTTIKQYIVSLVDPTYQRAMSQIIDYVLGLDETVFFVGQNTQDIVGICGELQGIFYLYEFFNEDPGALGTQIKWQGGLHSGDKGQKPHIDILLNDLFGIQIKNSTKIALDNIDFADASAETVLSKLDIGEDLRQLIENYYGTLYFNIGWNIDEEGNYYHNQAHPWNGNGRAQEYLNIYQRLLDMETKIEKLLAFSAAALMYMGIRDQANQLDANVVYILGGSTIYVASMILEQILKNIDDELKLVETFSVRFDRSKVDRTIVDALNDSRSRRQSLQKEGTPYSSEILRKAILTSSFNFGSLEIVS